jgi:dTDP-4-dehydrorhamnose reductase
MVGIVPTVTSAPPAPRDEIELEEMLSRPDDGAVRGLAECPGDVLVLGAGGKMGPSVSRMVRRAATDRRRVIAVSRFSSRPLRDALEQAGIETISCDLTDPGAIARLPDSPNIIFMAGQKFGTGGAAPATWAANAAIPALCASRFPEARTVVFSTGNVYGLTPAGARGSRESDMPAPVGEYANSALGRERIYEFYSDRLGSPVAIVRLNYAIDLRYGVLVDIALAVHRNEPVDVRMGWVNVIWQGDASARAIACLRVAASPPMVINVTGAETLRVRDLALRFGALLGRQPTFVGEEAADALLSDASRMVELLGAPSLSVDHLMQWVAEWIRGGGALLGKPTSFQVRDGRY